MMRKAGLGSAIACVVAALAVASALPVHAKDWTGDFPPGSDIPPVLGKYDTKFLVDAGPAPSGGWYPCAAFTVPSAKTVVSAVYAPKATRFERDVNARAYVYPSATDAQDAYKALRNKLSKCDGTSMLTFGDSGPDTMRRTTTTGTLDELSVTGVPSVYVYSKTVPLPGVGQPKVNSGGSYDVFTLVNDAILMTSAAQVGKRGYNPAQRAAVVDFASDFEETWVLGNS